MIAVAAQAQIVSSRSQSVTTSTTVNQFENYKRLYVGFSSRSFKPKGEDNRNLSGVVFGYLGGISLTQSMPLYLEVGANVQYNAKTESKRHYDIKYNYLGINVPVNVTYRFDLDNGIIIAPYTGLHLTGNLLANAKIDDESYSFFDDDDFDETAKRVQFGWQIGANFSYKALNIGLEYNLDFNEFMKDCTTSGFYATVGYNF